MAKRKRTSRAKRAETIENLEPDLDFDIWQMGQMNRAADAKIVLCNASKRACEALEMLAVIHSMLDEEHLAEVEEAASDLRLSIRTFERSQRSQAAHS